jgi:protocatechuate 3,4-dioxygenase beta subunit
MMTVKQTGGLQVSKPGSGSPADNDDPAFLIGTLGVTPLAAVPAAPVVVRSSTRTQVPPAALPASLIAHVYLDTNGNGSQDGREEDLAGLMVNLLNGNGTATGRTAVTDARGNVSFAGLAPGSYQVSVATPTSYRMSQRINVLAPIALTSGSMVRAIEGVYLPATVTAHVYTDANADGRQSGGDANLGGVTVSLLKGDGSATGKTAVTDGNGNVRFTGLLPASYQVSVVAPVGYAALQKTNVLRPLALASGATAAAIEGVYAPVTFSTHVYTDVNGNGRQDSGDTDLSGVRVTLLRGNGAGTGKSALTDSNGNVMFSGLLPGTYQVSIANPAGDRPMQSDGVLQPFALLSGGAAQAVEGVYVPGTITAHAYTDSNGNGLQDNGEISLAGVQVSLLDQGGRVIGAAVETNAGGNASFTDLAPGEYEVSVVTPTGDTVTQQTNLATLMTLASGGSLATVVGFAATLNAAIAVTPLISAGVISAGAGSDVGLVPVGTPVYAAGARVLTVGADKQYQSIAAAIGASRDGDVILVDSGTYTNDFAVVSTKISLIAVGGRVVMNATVPPPNFKGILTEETDLTVIGFDFTNCRIPDEEGHNGAGIRVDNGRLVLINDSFTGNQDGLLTNAGSTISITIDHCLFNDNGGADGNGAGNIHNVYIGGVASATVTNSVFENAQVGHEFKSRAAVNTLTNNVFISGVGIGTGSYDIDLPNGGVDVLTNNTIIKGASAENPNMVHFGGEGIPYAGSTLSITGNVFRSTNANAIGLLNQTSITARLSGNILDGLSQQTFIQGPATASNNWDISGTQLPDANLVGVLPGNTRIITDSDPHNVVMQGNQILAIEGGAGLLTLTVNDGHIIAIGGPGGMNVTENATTGGNQYTTAAGSANVLNLAGVGMDSIDSEGTDTIIAGNGNQSAQINGNATVTGGAGNSQWSVNGTASIDTGSGSAFMTLGAAGHLSITGTNGFFELNTNGGSATWNTRNAGVPVVGSVAGGAIAMQVYSGRANITTSGGGAGAVLNLDQGDASVRSAGADTIYAGAGNDTVIVSGAAQVHAGSGSLSVFGRSDPGGADVFGLNGDTIIDGDTGNITYHGDAQANTVEARLSNITLVGGAGVMTVNGGTRLTLSGGPGGIVFNDFGGGANTISTMAGSSNTLHVSGSNQIDSHGSDSIVHDGGNTSIAIHGDSNLTLLDGNSQVVLSGHDTVNVAAGNDSFTVTQGGQVSFALANMNSIHETSASVDVAFRDPTTPGAAASTVSVQGGVADIVTQPGSAVSVVTGGSAPVAVTAGGAVAITSKGADNIHLGAGSGYIVLQGSGAEIWAGAGALTLNDYAPSGGRFTLHGGSGSLVVNQVPATMTFIGGSGSASLSGGRMSVTAGSGDLTITDAQVLAFQGGSGSASLSLNAAGSSVTFGTGRTTVREQGSGAANTFRFLAGQSGANVISGFAVGTDRAVLGAGVSVLSRGIVGGSAQFGLSNGSTVTFTGITSTQGIFN